MQSREHFGDGFAGDGVFDLGGDLGQRLEDEAPLMHTGVRKRQFIGFHDLIVEQKEVQVDRSGAVSGFGIAVAAEALFNTQEGSEQVRRRQIRLENRGGIHEGTGLRGGIDRCCFTEAGDGGNVRGRQEDYRDN